MQQSAGENCAAVTQTDAPVPALKKRPQDAFALGWLLWRERRFIARLTSVGVIAGVIIALLIPSMYTATAQLMPPDATGPGAMAAMAATMTDKAGGLGTAAADLLGFKSSGALFVGILESRTVEDSLISTFDLRKAYHVKHWYEARKILGERTDITEDRKSGLISLEVTDSNRERAQKMAKAYVDELNRVVATSSMSAAGRERAFIEQQMVEEQKELDESARALADFSSKNNTIDLKEQARAMLDAVADVQGQLIASEAELKGLQSIYSDNNIRVRSAKAKIAELKRKVSEFGGAAGDSKARVAGDYPTVRQLPGLGVTYEDLYRHNKIAEAIYEALVQQYEMAKIQEAKDTPKVQMLDLPEVPEVKSYPPRALIVLACMLLSFCFSGGWVIACDRWGAIEEANAGKALVRDISETIRRQPIWQSGRVLRIRQISAMTNARFKRGRGRATVAEVGSTPAD